jgi:hypothetical protein
MITAEDRAEAARLAPPTEAERQRLAELLRASCRQGV